MMTQVLVIEEGSGLCAALAKIIGNGVAVQSLPTLAATLDRPMNADYDLILRGVGATSESNCQNSEKVCEP